MSDLSGGIQLRKRTPEPPTLMPMGRGIGHLISVDLGKRSDFAAIGVLQPIYQFFHAAALPERQLQLVRGGSRQLRLHINLRHLERMQKRYRQVIDRVHLVMDRVYHSADELPSGAIALVVDVSGVGDPIVEWMQEGKLSPIPILIVGGNTVLQPSKTDQRWHVPRKHIATNLQGVVEARRLHTPTQARLPIVKKLREEMDHLQAVEKRRAPDEIILSDEDHDDLAMCVGQGVWYLTKVLPSLKAADPPPPRPKFDLLHGRRE